MASAIIATATTIVAAVIGVNSYFARAEDVKEMARRQNETLEVLKQNNARSLLFQMDYYDNNIKRLETQKQEYFKMPATARREEALRDTENQILEQKLKRDFTRNQLVDGARK